MFAYFSEFSPSEYRGRMISVVSYFWIIGNTLVAGTEDRRSGSRPKTDPQSSCIGRRLPPSAPLVLSARRHFLISLARRHQLHKLFDVGCSTDSVGTRCEHCAWELRFWMRAVPAVRASGARKTLTYFERTRIVCTAAAIKL